MARSGTTDPTTGLTRIGGDTGLNYAPVLIANTWLPRLQDKLQFLMLLTGAQENGRAQMFNRKIGDRFYVRRPFRTNTYNHRVLQSGDLRKPIERLVEVLLDTWSGTGLEYNTEQVTLAIKERDKRQFIDPGIEEMAYRYDYRASKELSQNTHLLHGTLTSYTYLTVDTVRQFGAHLSHMSVFPDECHLTLDPMDCAAIEKDIQDLTAPAGLVTRVVQGQYKGRLARFMVHESNTIPTIDVPSQAGLTVTLASGSDKKGSTLILRVANGGTSAITAAQARKLLNKGNKIKIAGVREVRVRGERLTTGRVKTFNVTEDVVLPSISAGGNGTVSIGISPEINDGTLSIELADGTTDYVLKDYETVDALPVSGAAVTVVGGSPAGAMTYRQAFGFRPDTAEFFITDLEEQTRNFTFSRQVRDMVLDTGLSLLFTEDGDFNTLEAKMRVDSLFTCKQTYPDVSGVIWTPETP